MSAQRLLVTVITLASLLVAFGVSAQIYSWKDASGRTVYSDQPPPDAKTPVANKPTAGPKYAPASDTGKGASSASADQGKTPAAQSAPSASQSGPKTWQERDLEYKQKKAADQEAEAKRKQEAERAEEKRAYCTSLRGNLALMQKGGRVAKLDANGERVFMEDEQMKREAEQLRSKIARDCS